MTGKNPGKGEENHEKIEEKSNQFDSECCDDPIHDASDIMGDCYRTG